MECINATTVNESDISLLAIENTGSNGVTVKYQVSFVAGSILASSGFCNSYLSSLTSAVTNDVFDTLLHQNVDSESPLKSAYCTSVSMNECSNASPPSYHYVKGPKQFDLSVVGVIVGIIIVLFGCCFLVGGSYYGYKYVKAKINPYEGMDIDELAAKLEMNKKKEDNNS